MHVLCWSWFFCDMTKLGLCLCNWHYRSAACINYIGIIFAYLHKLYINIGWHYSLPRVMNQQSVNWTNQPIPAVPNWPRAQLSGMAHPHTPCMLNMHAPRPSPPLWSGASPIAVALIWHASQHHRPITSLARPRRPLLTAIPSLHLPPVPLVSCAPHRWATNDSAGGWRWQEWLNKP
jgi:hypothetical protein